ncbi:hypothetical protein SKAU_G00385250 [Synaphobranchus kaupii]|uniref:Uncharacterized protein n=1 Tax=Synaphobranchus kaupii TaxID=118154 RepID=A0A9Q1IE83_SYNKA|nr:hypothetical protein SKAU_G00385250 [Synaphobranchus kaupii]
MRAHEGPGRAGWDIQSDGDFQLVRAARIVFPWSSKLGYVAKGTHPRPNPVLRRWARQWPKNPQNIFRPLPGPAAEHRIGPRLVGTRSLPMNAWIPAPSRTERGFPR